MHQETHGETGSGWLAPAVVSIALAAWFLSSVIAPSSPRPLAPESPANLPADALPSVVGWPATSSTTAWELRTGTATESPYAVMIAMAEHESAGDRLALARAASLVPREVPQ